MNLTLPEACEAVADLFEAVPETFCKLAYARDEFGAELWVADDPKAESWCVIGGVAAAANEDVGSAYLFLEPSARKLYPDLGGNSAVVNNTLGRLAAIRLLREAAKCQK